MLTTLILVPTFALLNWNAITFASPIPYRYTRDVSFPTSSGLEEHGSSGSGMSAPQDHTPDHFYNTARNLVRSIGDTSPLEEETKVDGVTTDDVVANYAGRDMAFPASRRQIQNQDYGTGANGTASSSNTTSYSSTSTTTSASPTTTTSQQNTRAARGHRRRNTHTISVYGRSFAGNWNVRDDRTQVDSGTTELELTRRQDDTPLPSLPVNGTSADTLVTSRSLPTGGSNANGDGYEIGTIPTADNHSTITPVDTTQTPSYSQRIEM